MKSESEVQSAHNSSETTNVAVSSLDDLTYGQLLCLNWAEEQDWDRIKGYAKEHPEVLLGVCKKHVDGEWKVASVLTNAAFAGDHAGEPHVLLFCIPLAIVVFCLKACVALYAVQALGD